MNENVIIPRKTQAESNSIQSRVFRDRDILTNASLQGLYLWARKEKINSGKGFNLYKTALKQIGVYYDVMKTQNRKW